MICDCLNSLVCMRDFKKLFTAFEQLKAGVIGDMMLDTYLWGHVERISPEAPVPVVTLDRREYPIGGAGNVALDPASLGRPGGAFLVFRKAQGALDMVRALGAHG